MSPSPPQAVTLTAADGMAIQALRYPSKGSERARIVVAGATGVPQRFYRHFAEFACGGRKTAVARDDIHHRERIGGQNIPARCHGALQGVGSNVMPGAQAFILFE